MLYDYSFSYLPCQNCHERIRCEICEEKVKSKLLAHNQIHAVYVQMNTKTLAVDASCDEDTLLDLMEDLGIFAD